MRAFYEHEYANVHRGVYRLAERATEGFEAARRTVAGLPQRAEREGGHLHPQRDRGAQPRRVRVGTRQPRPRRRRRHHRARAPRELRPVAVHRVPDGRELPPHPDRRPGRAPARRARRARARGNVKVVANNLVSNTLGTINPVAELAAWAHEHGAIMVVDAAQAAPHRVVDVQALGADFVAIPCTSSAGRAAIGALWGRSELLEQMSPFNLGGEMIRSVGLEKTSFNELPHKFEAGTPAIAEAVGFGAAIDYVTAARARGDRAARARARRADDGRARRDPLDPGLRAAGRAGARGSSRSTSRGSTRTTSRRSSTGRASPSGRGTTARSR